MPFRKRQNALTNAEFAVRDRQILAEPLTIWPVCCLSDHSDGLADSRTGWLPPVPVDSAADADDVCIGTLFAPSEFIRSFVPIGNCQPVIDESGPGS